MNKIYSRNSYSNPWHGRRLLNDFAVVLKGVHCSIAPDLQQDCSGTPMRQESYYEGGGNTIRDIESALRAGSCYSESVVRCRLTQYGGEDCER